MELPVNGAQVHVHGVLGDVELLGAFLLDEAFHERAQHFFPAALLDSQLAALEEPDGKPGDDGAIVIDAGLPVADIVAAIRAALEQPRG